MSKEDGKKDINVQFKTTESLESKFEKLMAEEGIKTRHDQLLYLVESAEFRREYESSKDKELYASEVRDIESATHTIFQAARALVRRLEDVRSKVAKEYDEQINVLENKLASSHANEERLKIQLEEKNGEQQRLEEEVDSLRDSASKSEELLQERSQRLDERASAIEDLKAKIRDLEEISSQKDLKLARFEESEQRIKELEETVRNMQHEKKQEQLDYENQIKELERANADKEAKIEQFNEQLNETKEANASLQEKVQEMQQDIARKEVEKKTELFEVREQERQQKAEALLERERKVEDLYEKIEELRNKREKDLEELRQSHATELSLLREAFQQENKDEEKREGK